MTSGVVYLFDCPRCSLGKYVGCTRRLLKVRIDSHCGVSYRTGETLRNPEHSSIRDHAKKCKHRIKYEDFRIIGKASNNHQLTILESLLIKQMVPQLNSQGSSTPLYLSWAYAATKVSSKFTQFLPSDLNGMVLSYLFLLYIYFTCIGFIIIVIFHSPCTYFLFV